MIVRRGATTVSAERIYDAIAGQAPTRRAARVATLDLNITSIAAGPPGSPLTRHCEFAADLNRDAVNARVWSGIHFRTADVVANGIGTDIGDRGLDHYFQPL
jgi:hypothetical protein